MFATGGGQLRRKKTCSKQDACGYEEANQLRNGARPIVKEKHLFETEWVQLHRSGIIFVTGCGQLRRSNTCSQRDAFNCDQVVRVRNRERSVTSKPASRCCSRILAPG